MATETATETRMKIQQRIAGPVRVTLPASVAFNADLLKKSITSLAEQLGCPKCFSGVDCAFQMHRDFIVDPAAKLAPSPQLEAVARPSRIAEAVTVSFAAGIKYDLNKILTAVDKVNTLLGCTPCHSGFDVYFRHQLELIVVNEKLEAQRFGPLF